MINDTGSTASFEEIDKAIEALKRGDDTKADALYERITENQQVTIKRAAKAYYERGKIAEHNYKYSKALEFYQLAVNFSPDNEVYTQSYKDLKNKLDVK